jgi:hypothetical protein
MSRRAKRRGFSFAAFFWGFLFAIIVELASLGGLIYYILFKANIDNLMGKVVPEYRDEEGNNAWINTDTENGGVSNIYELIQKLISFSSDIGNQTLDDLNSIFPVINNLLLLEGDDGMVLKLLESYGLDLTEVTYNGKDIHTVTFSEFSSFLPEVVKAIQPAKIEAIQSYIFGDSANPIVASLLLGQEAEYVSVNSKTYPVYYDVYRQTSDNSYVRLLGSNGNYTEDASGTITAGGGVQLASVNIATATGHVDYTQYLDKQEDGTYRLYYYLYTGKGSSANGDAIVTYKQEDGTYGNIFDDPIDGTPILVNGQPEYTYADFYETAIYENYDYYTQQTENKPRLTGYYYYNEYKEIVYDTKVTIGSLMENGVLSSMETVAITDIMDMLGVSTEGVFGELIDGVTVGDLMKDGGMSDLINGITLSTFIEAQADNAILSYLGYGVYDMQAQNGSDYQYVAKYDVSGEPYTCYLTVKDGVISGGYYYENNTLGEKKVAMSGTTIADVTNMIDGVTDKLALSDFMDISVTDSNIMTFIAFGITQDNGVAYYHIPAGNGAEAQTVVCQLVTSGSVIKGATYQLNGTTYDVNKTKINDVSGMITRVMDELPIHDVVDGWNNENELMRKIGNYTINNVSNALDDLVITDVMDLDAPTAEEKNAIMIYLAYGVSDINVVEGQSYAFTASFEGKTVYGETADGKVTRIYYVENGSQVELTSTGINDVDARINGVTDALTIGDIVQADDGILAKLSGYKISELEDAVQTLNLSDVMDISAPTENDKKAVLLYIGYGVTNVQITEEGKSFTADYQGKTAYGVIENGVVARVYYKENGEEIELGTKVEEVSSMVDGVMNDLTLGEIMTIDDSNKVLYALKDSTINELSSNIAKLSVQELYADEIYDGAELAKAEVYNAAYLYYTEAGELVNGTGKLTEEQVLTFATGSYYTYGAPKGAWRFMLYENGEEKVYTINDMGKLMTNTTSNINTAKLRELADAGIIEGDNLYNENGEEKVLVIPDKNNPMGEGKRYVLADLTIAELLEAVSSLAE